MTEELEDAAEFVDRHQPSASSRGRKERNMEAVRKTSQDFLQDEDDDDCYGSCERCGCNLYEGDGDEYCDQCEWWIEQVTPEER